MTAVACYGGEVGRLDIVARLKRLTRDVINSSLSDEYFSSDVSFFDLGLASLNVVELLSAIEQEFDVIVDGDELSAELFMRFDNMVALVAKKVGEGRH